MSEHIEVPEPSTRVACPHWAEGKITMRKGCTACAAEGREPEPQGEPSDVPTVQLMAQKGGKKQALIDQMLAQANQRGIRVEVVNQTIPKYAMLDVWMALYGHETSQAFDPFYWGSGYAEAWSTLLSVIRERAGEPQGEPSDAQVHAAWLAVNGVITQAQMRAALRAAAQAGGER